MTTRHRPLSFAIALLAIAAAAAGQDRPKQIDANHADTVFLCSRAKSMADVFPQVKQEIGNMTAAAAETAKFDVILFGGGAADAPQKLSPTMLPATAANKKKAADFVAKATAATTGGTPKLAAALAAALALHPQLINVVVDGAADADKADDWVKAVNQTNGRVKVRCIYLQADANTAADKAATAGLKKLVAAGHGEFIVIDKKDFQK